MKKQKRYETALMALNQFIGPQGYAMTEIGKMATIAAYLSQTFPEWLFVGFYRVVKDGMLEIGPYQGSVIACGTIAFDRGVCGLCATRRTTIVVPDVKTFPGYISCDDETISEIVVPVIRNDTVVAVLDIDSAVENDFDATDQHYLEQIVRLL